MTPKDLIKLAAILCSFFLAMILIAQYNNDKKLELVKFCIEVHKDLKECAGMFK